MPAVVRFDPFRDITSLRDEMNRLFTRTLGEGGSAGGPRGPRPWTSSTPPTPSC